MDTSFKKRFEFQPGIFNKLKLFFKCPYYIIRKVQYMSMFLNRPWLLKYMLATWPDEDCAWSNLGRNCEISLIPMLENALK